MRTTIPLLFLAVAVATTACEDDPVDSGRVAEPCTDGERQVVFKLDGASDVIRCVQLDTLLASSSPACTVVVWTAPRNQRQDEGFRYEASAGDPGQPCGTGAFFAVMQNSSGGYTYFDGLVRRDFDSGSGPFAAGVYEVLNGQQTLVGIGQFEFWE